MKKKELQKDGAKLVNAVSTASVPKITIIIGGSFGQVIMQCVEELTVRDSYFLGLILKFLLWEEK